MGAFKTDSEGHIIADETMSEELKEKINQYNSYLDSDSLVDPEISDEEADSFVGSSEDEDDEYDDDESEDDYVTVEIEDESVDEEELNSLNDLFS